VSLTELVRVVVGPDGSVRVATEQGSFACEQHA
jgi:hypothetical protein